VFIFVYFWNNNKKTKFGSTSINYRYDLLPESGALWVKIGAFLLYEKVFAKEKKHVTVKTIHFERSSESKFEMSRQQARVRRGFAHR